MYEGKIEKVVVMDWFTFKETTLEFIGFKMEEKQLKLLWELVLESI